VSVHSEHSPHALVIPFGFQKANLISPLAYRLNYFSVIRLSYTPEAGARPSIQDNTSTTAAFGSEIQALGAVHVQCRSGTAASAGTDPSL